MSNEEEDCNTTWYTFWRKISVFDKVTLCRQSSRVLAVVFAGVGMSRALSEQTKARLAANLCSCREELGAPAAVRCQVRGRSFPSSSGLWCGTMRKRSFVRRGEGKRSRTD